MFRQRRLTSYAAFGGAARVRGAFGGSHWEYQAKPFRAGVAESGTGVCVKDNVERIAVVGKAREIRNQ